MPDNNFSFIEEQIRPQKAKKVKKILKKTGITAALAAVFGTVAACAFHITGSIIHGTDGEEPEREVSLVVATDAPEVNPTESPVPDNVNKSDENPKKPDDKKESKEGIGDYAAMYRNLADYCNEYSSTIVTIARIEKGMDYFENQVELSASFYGLVLQKDNDMVYVLTEYDYIDEGCSYSMILRDGSRIEAEIMGTDTLTGLAVMSADISGLSKKSADTLKIAELGSSNGVRKGDIVVAIGNPTGVMGSIGYGLVYAEPEVEYITDRSVHIYSSGIANVESGNGVVMDDNGKVVGIITHRFSSDMSMCCFMGINDLKVIIEQLMNNQRRAAMGIIPKDIGDEFFVGKEVDRGIYVSDIHAESSVIDAGLVVGDIITAINGECIGSVEDYMKVLASFSPDDTVEVDIYRDYASKNKRRKVNVTLSEAL